jgi:hypothetical protein
MRRPPLGAPALAWLLAAAAARAEGEGVAIARVEVRGLGRTRRPAVVELLPRPPPARYRDAELVEFRRRVANLHLFDHVEVAREGDALYVDVREKLSVSPVVDVSTGKTWRDAAFTLGAIENNVGGRAVRLGGEAEYVDRGPQFELWLAEHDYHPRRWAVEAEAGYTSAGFRFDEGDASPSWQRTRAGGAVGLKAPYAYGLPLRTKLVARAYHEYLTRAEGGPRPAEGTYVGVASETYWDAYVWHDLVPRGLLVMLELNPGIFLGAAEPRHHVHLEALGAAPLGGTTVLAARAGAEAVNAGNPNHSSLLGSQEGVRGLRDSFYRNQAQGYVNLELRHAIGLGKRWYVQPVAFADAAAFVPFAPSGRATRWLGALSAGAGARLVPTALVDTLLRVDLARLAAPEAGWFVQAGIAQYF